MIRVSYAGEVERNAPSDERKVEALAGHVNFMRTATAEERKQIQCINVLYV